MNLYYALGMLISFPLIIRNKDPRKDLLIFIGSISLVAIALPLSKTDDTLRFLQILCGPFLSCLLIGLLNTTGVNFNKKKG